MADWSFVAGGTPPSGGPSIALSNARARTITMRTAADQVSEATFTLDGRDPQAAAFVELSNDLWCYRAGTMIPIFVGRIGPTSDAIDADRHTVTVTAWDYRTIFNRRRLWSTDTLSWTAVDQATIAANLIRDVQTHSGGNLGVVPGSGTTTGIVRTIMFTDADMVTACIVKLAQLDSGFEWDIVPHGDQDLRLDIWYPTRGSPRGVILEQGSTLVKTITRTVDPSTFADALLVTGDSSAGLTQQEIATSDIGTRAEGRWDQIIGTDLLTQSALNSRTTFELAAAGIVAPAYSIELVPNVWQGPGHIWLGDPVTVRIKSGRLAVNASYRVMEITIAVGDDGDERVTLTLGAIPVDPARLIADMVRRLRNLESR